MRSRTAVSCGIEQTPMAVPSSLRARNREGETTMTDTERDTDAPGSEPQGSDADTAARAQPRVSASTLEAASAVVQYYADLPVAPVWASEATPGD